MAMPKGYLERAVSHDTWIVGLAVGLIVALAGLYTFRGVGMEMSALDMTRMAGPVGAPMQGGAPAVWTWEHAFVMLMMWWIMMIAMMTPSAAPTLLLYSALKRRSSEKERAAVLSLVFLTGYLLVWAVLSMAATGLQWLAESTGVANGSMMAINSRVVAGIVLILAGLFQYSSLKTACLTHCRSPAHFLARHRGNGLRGALATGMRHGAFCLGCCWALMALLFVGGVMNLFWIVGLALYVLAEKLVPYPRAFSRMAGAILVVAGAWTIAPGLSG